MPCVLADAVPLLRCPHCRGVVDLETRVLRCRSGHAFDVARQGYVNLLTGGRRPPGDSAAMVERRDRVLAAGRLAPLTDALRSAAADLPPGCVVDVGAGTGHHLAAVLDASSRSGTDRIGIALDTSVPALRRAARCHPRVAALGADAWGRWPLADGVAACVLAVFAPRDAAEIARVLAPGGVLLLTSPQPDHLSGLVAPLGLLAPGRPAPEPSAGASDVGLVAEDRVDVRWTMHLDRAEAADVALMGPSAFHRSPTDVAAALAGLSEPLGVTGAVTVTRWRRRSG